MQRKILLAIVVLCLLGILVSLVVFLKKNVETPNNASKAIPADAALVVEIKSLDRAAEVFSANEKLLDAFSQLALIQKGIEFIVKIDSVTDVNERFASFADNEFYFVVKKIGQNKLDNLYIVSLGKNQSSDLVKELIETTFDLTGASAYEYKTVPIYSYKDEASDRKNLSYAVYKNTVMISESKVSVEAALKGFFDDNNLDNDSDFKKIRPNASKVPARIFFHYDRMASIMQLYASSEYVNRIKDFHKIASWTELDLNIDKKSIRLNGYITTDSAHCEAEYMNLFKGQQAVRGEIFSVLPASSVNFVAACISDKAVFRKNYENYLSKNSFFNAYNNDLKSLDAEFAMEDGKSVENFFYSWLDKELAYVQMPSFSDFCYENTFGVIKLENRKSAEEEFVTLLKKYAEKNQTDLNVSEQVVGDNEYEIFKMPVLKLPQMIWGNLFSHMTAKYAFFVDSFLVFGNTMSSCLAYLNELEKGRNLSSDSDYGRFDDNLKSSYSLYVYASIPQSLSTFREFFNENTVQILDSYSNDLKDFGAISYQLIADNDDKIYNDIFISLESNKMEKPEIEWRNLLDTVVASRPTIFVSHNGESLTLVQDMKNTLYLFDNTKGKMLWSKQLDGRILGKIFFVDALKNQKIQYMFNTANTIYLIDKNGDSVGNFPILLNSPATTSISVFDYDNVKKYRIAVPCENLSIKLYGMERGLWTTISDWNVTTESEVKSPLQHFSDAGKDYIVFADKYNFHILNRRGEARVEIDEIFEKAPNAFIEFEAGAEPSLSRFITTDADGIVKEIYVNGTISSSDKFGKRSNLHYFMKADINNDGNGDYVFVDENKVEAYSQDAKKIFSYSANSTLSSPFIKQLKNGESKVCAIDKHDGKVYVINCDGSLYKGFPIEGHSAFDISDDLFDKGFRLIVGGEQNLLYNYGAK